MNLRLLLPVGVFTKEDDVKRVVAETHEGAFGLLPHRLDCVAALVPGILMYETSDSAEVFVAVDDGVLIKTGSEVLISVRRAICGTELSQLRTAVEEQFLQEDELTRNVRAVMAKLESSFLRRISYLRHE